MSEPVCYQTDPLTKTEHAAIKEVYAGTADDYQQRLCLEVIIKKFSRAGDMLHVANKPDETTFLAGRGFVGQLVTKYIKLPVDPPEENNDATGRPQPES